MIVEKKFKIVNVELGELSACSSEFYFSRVIFAGIKSAILQIFVLKNYISCIYLSCYSYLNKKKIRMFLNNNFS